MSSKKGTENGARNRTRKWNKKWVKRWQRIFKQYKDIKYVNGMGNGMGNDLNKYKDSVVSSPDKRENYTDIFTGLSDDTEEKIRENYKVIDVGWLDSIEVKSEMFGDEFFQKNLKEKEMVNEMVDFYLTHKDKAIYKKTDYLCIEREKICICNTHAEDLRKIYDGCNYKPGDKYISWIKKSNKPF
jgi:hypothetical protein